MPKLLRGPTRHQNTPVADSHRWDTFEPRDGDIVIATFAKCGTTWTQRIVDLLVWQSPDVRPFGDISPWLDSKIFNTLEEDLATLRAQTHRRYIKSHLTFDGLPVWDTVKYIHTGRDARDAALSWQNHMLGTRPEFGMKVAMNAMAMAAEGAGPPMAGPPPAIAEDPHQHLVNWLGEQEAALAGGPGPMGFFEFEKTYWDERTRPNLLFVHYNDLKENLEGEMRRISDFLEIDTPASLLPKLAAAAQFESMKKDGDALFPKLKDAFDRGADRFINQGRSGRWKEVATAEDIARYDAIVRQAAPPAMAAWLEQGRLGAGDPREIED